MLGLGSPFTNSNLKFFFKTRSGERLKYRRKRVIFHEASASLTCLLSGLLATNHRNTPPAHLTTSPALLRLSLAALAASLRLLFSSLATSSSPSLSSSKLLITLTADDLDRFGFWCLLNGLLFANVCSLNFRNLFCSERCLTLMCPVLGGGAIEDCIATPETAESQPKYPKVLSACR